MAARAAGATRRLQRQGWAATTGLARTVSETTDGGAGDSASGQRHTATVRRDLYAPVRIGLRGLSAILTAARAARRRGLDRRALPARPTAPRRAAWSVRFIHLADHSSGEEKLHAVRRPEPTHLGLIAPAVPALRSREGSTTPPPLRVYASDSNPSEHTSCKTMPRSLRHRPRDTRRAPPSIRSQTHVMSEYLCFYGRLQHSTDCGNPEGGGCSRSRGGQQTLSLGTYSRPTIRTKMVGELRVDSPWRLPR